MKGKTFLFVITVALLVSALSGCSERGGIECPGGKDYKITFENGTVEYVAARLCSMEAGSVSCRKCRACIPFVSYNNAEKLELCQR